MSLLDEALKAERIPKSDTVTTEQIELGIAWAEGTVSTGAVSRALGFASASSSYPVICRFLQAALREGYLKRTNKKTSEEKNVVTTVA